jgi:hypothetical protein
MPEQGAARTARFQTVEKHAFLAKPFSAPSSWLRCRQDFHRGRNMSTVFDAAWAGFWQVRQKTMKVQTNQMSSRPQRPTGITLP